MLTVGGLYVGLCDKFERFLKIDPRDRFPVEISPIGDYFPVRFLFDEEFLFSPPEHVSLYYYRNSVAVYAHDFLRADDGMKVLFQTSLFDTSFTLYRQGKLFLSMENKEGFFLVELPCGMADCEISPCGEDFLLAAEGEFALVSRTGKLLLHAEGRVTECDSDEKGILKGIVPLGDSRGRSANCVWKGGKLLSREILPGTPPPDLPVAFFESILCGEDVSGYLCEDLLPRKEELREFLGDFRSVVLLEREKKVGLVYPRKERVFDVRSFTVELVEGKISNLFVDEG